MPHHDRLRSRRSRRFSRRALLLGVLISPGVVTRAAAAQRPSDIRWTRLPSDSSAMAWMDTTRIAPEPDGYVGGWYKVEAAGETKYTVVHYAVDCPGFCLTITRS